MQHIALSTGIVLDPVYSGKALYHLFQVGQWSRFFFRTGQWDECVVQLARVCLFLHTYIQCRVPTSISLITFGRRTCNFPRMYSTTTMRTWLWMKLGYHHNLSWTWPSVTLYSMVNFTYPESWVSDIVNTNQNEWFEITTSFIHTPSTIYTSLVYSLFYISKSSLFEKGRETDV